MHVIEKKSSRMGLRTHYKILDYDGTEHKVKLVGLGSLKVMEMLTLC